MKESNLAIVSGGPLETGWLRNKSLGNVLLEAARRGFGSITCLDDEGVETTLSYQALLDDSRCLLSGLNDQGIKKGDRIILQTGMAINTLRLIWSAFLGGIVVVPMPVPRTAEDQAALKKLFIVWDMLGCPPIISDSASAKSLAGLADKPEWKKCRWLSTETLLRHAPIQVLPELDPNSVAMLPLTSGSTGVPKAVQLSHANILSMAAGTIAANGFTQADVSLNWMPLDHPGANVFLGIVPAVLGSRQVHIPTAFILAEPMRWLELIDRHRASISWAPNFAFALIAQEKKRLADLSIDLSSMRFLVTSGEQVSAAVSLAALEVMMEHGMAEKALRPAFGMAETCSGIIWSSGMTRALLAENPTWISLGTPIPGASVRITDDAGHILPEGAIGNVSLFGPSVTRGYLDNEEANKEALMADGWFATGDQGFIKDRELYLTGRKKLLVIINGLNVAVHDIEAATEAVDGVQTSYTAAFSVMNPERNTEALVVCFCPADDKPSDPATLARHVRTHLTRETGIVPTHLVVLTKGEIPKTSIGKIQRPELKRRFESGAYKDHTFSLPVIKPITDTEDTTAEDTADTKALIAGIWKEVLGLSTVGLNDNFFDLGGHSILLTQAHARLKKKFPALELVDLFKYATVQSLSDFLEQGLNKTPAPGTGRQRTGMANGDIAVIGMACRFPGADSIDEFWQNLRAGRESIKRFDTEELLAAGWDEALISHPNYVPASPVLKDAAGFDAAFFGISAREAELMDPQHRHFLECAWEAFEDAGYVPHDYPGSVGAFVSASMNTYFVNNVLPQRHKLDERDPLGVFTLDSMGGFQAMVGNDKDYISTRVSYKLNLRGPSINLQTACSSGLVAIHMAVQSLLSGECDMALAGASSVQSPQAAGHHFQEGMIVTSDGHCRAFDADASGTIFGSGVGAVLLKPLSKALADGDAIYAVIRGSAVNNDGGQKVGYMAPSGEGGTRAAQEALSVAGVPPESISFIEAHGTGTSMGDPIEFASLAAAIDAPDRPRQSCALGAVKTNVGHLQIASGMVGFIKTVLALHHREIPPTLHFSRANPAIALKSSPFFINTELISWTPYPGQPRRAGVNSLGIGGTNAHVILEEAPLPAATPKDSDRPMHLLCLSAQTVGAMERQIRAWRAYLDRHPDVDPADLCFTANSGRRHFPLRSAFLFSDLAQLQEQLAKATHPEHTPVKARPIVFRFTGNTVRSGAGESLFRCSPPFRAALEQCDALFRERGAPSLIASLYQGESWSADPAFVEAASASLAYAAAQLLAGWNIHPDRMLSSDSGAAVSACLSGKISLSQMIDAVFSGQKLAASAGELGEGTVHIDLPVLEWAPLLELARRVHLQGGHLDWAGFDRPYARKRLHLPTYPFEHRRYWIDAPRHRSAASVAEATAGHPLIERRFDSPLLPGTLCESHFDAKRQAVFSDHLIYGRPVVSGACYVSMMLGAAKLGEAVRVAGVTFIEPLVLPVEGIKVQLAITQSKEGPSLFKLISVGADQSMQTHVTGNIEAAASATGSEPASFAETASLCPEVVDLEKHYQRLSARHIDLGSSYRWMTSLYRGTNDRGVCKLCLPESLDESVAEAFVLHPGLIDSCFGLLVSTIEMNVEETFIPSSIEALTLRCRPHGRRFWARGQFRRLEDNRGATGNIELFSEDGSLIMEISGLTGRLARREQIMGKTAEESLFYQVDLKPAPLPAGNIRPLSDRIVIFTDKIGVGEALTRQLKAQGLAADCFDATDTNGLSGFLESAAGKAASLTLVHLQSLDIPAAIASDKDLSFARRTGAEHVLTLVQALVEKGVDARLLLVTRGGQALGKAAPAAAQAPLWGLCRVLRLEFPSLDFRTVDLDTAEADPERLAMTLARELAVDDSAETVWRRGERFMPLLNRLPRPSAAPLALNADACYLVSGASGALGKLVLGWLADCGARHIVTSSRRGVIDPALKSGLEERGVHLYSLSADIGDSKAFDTAWEGIASTLPPLRGIVHAAGVLEDASSLNMTAGLFEAVARPKMEGAWNLARLAQASSTDFFLLFSSAASLLGNRGQSNYAAANAFLDVFSQSLRQRGIKATSVSWGPWRGAGMATSDKASANLGRLGIRSFSPEDAAGLLNSLVACNLGHVCVIDCDWKLWNKGNGEYSKQGHLLQNLAQTQGDSKPRAALLSATPLTPNLVASLAKAPTAERREMLQDFLTATLKDALGLSPLDTINPRVPLMEQSLDSLTSLGVRSKINEAMGKVFPVGILFEHPTIEALVAYLDSETLPPATTDKRDPRLAELDGMQWSELNALVNEELEKK